MGRWVNSQLLTGGTTQTYTDKSFTRQRKVTLFFPVGVKKQNQIVHGIGIGNR